MGVGVLGRHLNLSPIVMLGCVIIDFYLVHLHQPSWMKSQEMVFIRGEGYRFFKPRIFHRSPGCGLLSSKESSGRAGSVWLCRSWDIVALIIPRSTGVLRGLLLMIHAFRTRLYLHTALGWKTWAISVWVSSNPHLKVAGLGGQLPARQENHELAGDEEREGVGMVFL